MTTANTNVKSVNESVSESKEKSVFLDKEASRKFRDTVRNYVDNYREYMTAVYNSVLPVDNSVINAWETIVDAFTRTVKERNLAKIEDPENCYSASKLIKEYRNLSASSNVATAISVFGTVASLTEDLRKANLRATLPDCKQYQSAYERALMTSNFPRTFEDLGWGTPSQIKANVAVCGALNAAVSAAVACFIKSVDTTSNQKFVDEAKKYRVIVRACKSKDEKGKEETTFRAYAMHVDDLPPMELGFVNLGEVGAYVSWTTPCGQNAAKNRVAKKTLQASQEGVCALVTALVVAYFNGGFTFDFTKMIQESEEAERQAAQRLENVAN